MSGQRKKGDERQQVTITVDGMPLNVPLGEPLATALLCAGYVCLRRSPNANGPRGAFCFMGACQECSIEVDGRLAQTCMVAAKDGMAVRLKGAPA
jgi:predicted molibdopterin-dependent oxidoreductase YjgC